VGSLKIIFCYPRLAKKQKMGGQPGTTKYHFGSNPGPPIIILGATWYHQKSFWAQPENTKNHFGGNLGPHKIIFGAIQGQRKSFRVQLGSNTNHVGGNLEPPTILLGATWDQELWPPTCAKVQTNPEL